MVVEQPAALTYELEQSAARVVILLVIAQVLGEVVDAIGQKRDLDLGGSGVFRVFAELADDLGCLSFWF